MAKLYLGITSVGEDLYCKGSAISVLQKQLNEIEKVVSNARAELRRLRKMLDPFQEILMWMDQIAKTRQAIAAEVGDPMYHMVGEVDAACEIHHILKEQGIEWPNQLK